jgi:hypothetical protein
MIEINSLTKVSDVIIAYDHADSLRIDLDYKRTLLERRLVNAVLNEQELAEDIRKLEAKLTSFKTVRDTMPDGPESQAIDALIAKTQSELDAAIADQSNSGIQGDISRQNEHANLNGRVTYIDEYESALTALREILPSV